jgi:hypothetical protein
VVAEDLGEDPPVLQPPIQRFVTCPHPPLHSPIPRRIHVVSPILVTLVGLDSRPARPARKSSLKPC